MKRLSFAILSALVLGLGLSVFAEQQKPASASASPKSQLASSRQAQPTKPAIAVNHEPAAPGQAASEAEQTALVKQYCASCHNDRNKNNAGGLTLASFDAAKVGHDAQVAEVAEKMIRKLRSGMMPPPNARRPEGATLANFAASMESRLDQSAALNPNPGRRPFQRLNRAEYTRAVRALLALDVDVNAFLPPDTISAGFDNVADAQTFSATLMEGYLRAASRISALAVGDPGPARRNSPTRCRAPARRCITSRARRSARAAASRRCTRSRRTASTRSACSSTRSRPASCSAARSEASCLKCRSTASAPRCSRSTRA
jgi:mono/diheme cytochrome c family protein